MCGLFAASGHVNAKIMTVLGCMNESRGTDSAGIAWSSKGITQFMKIAQHPLVAFPLTLQSVIRNAARVKCPVIGHTRQATQGKVTSDNAHPFLDEASKIAWAHNGVINNDEEFGKFEVDSECLIQGIKEKNFSKFRGSIALVWLEDGLLHSYRKGNPLFRGRHGRAVYLASERKMLEAVGCSNIREIAEGRIYRFKGHAVENVHVVPTNTYTVYSNDSYSGFHNDYNRGCSTNANRCSCGKHWSQWLCDEDKKKSDAKDKEQTLVEIPSDNGGFETVTLDEFTKKNEQTLSIIKAEAGIVDEDGRHHGVSLCDACGMIRNTTASEFCADCLKCFGMSH